MASVNKTILIGRVGRDPEKGTSSNSPVTLPLATHEVWRDKDGNKQEDLQWHRIVVWGNQGDNVLKYVKKGDLLYIEGKIQTESYEKDGQTLYTTKIVTREVRFLTPKSQNTAPATPQPAAQPSASVDDVPF